MSTPDTYRPETPLNEIWQRYIAENPRARSEHTARLMRISVQNLQSFLGRLGMLSDLNNATLVAFGDHRRHLGLSPRTIERELTKLGSLWRWAANEGLCALPRFSVQKCAPPTPTAWSPEEWDRIIDSTWKYQSVFCGLPAGVVMRAFILLAYDSGERLTALRAVKWEDVNLDTRWVTIRGETRKGGARAADNVQRLGRDCVKSLRELEGVYQATSLDTELIFPPVDRTLMYHHLKSILKIAGLPAGRGDMFHKIRRTHATHLHMRGGDATASLGHESDAMTRGYYLDPRYTRGGYLAEVNAGIMVAIGRMFRRLKRAFGII